MPKKPVNPFKLATLPEWQQQRIKADEAKAKAAQVQGSALKSFSSKRLAKLGSKTLFSTFTPKSGTKTLIKRHEIKHHAISSLRQRTGVLKQGSKLRKRSAAQADKLKQLAALKERMLAIWGERCVFNFLGGCKGRLEMMHGYSQQAHPERALDIANVLPGCLGHHRTDLRNCHNHNPMDVALKAAVDLVTAAVKDKRPQPSWEELQAEIKLVLVQVERKQRRQKEA